MAVFPPETNANVTKLE